MEHTKEIEAISRALSLSLSLLRLGTGNEREARFIL